MGDRRRQLNEKQLQAIDLILAGYTDGEVAEKIGVSRQTVNEWKNKNPSFIAELNRRKKTIYEATLNRLINLRMKALNVVEKEIEKGNVKLALEILKMTADLEDFGPTDEEDVDLMMKEKKSERASKKLTMLPTAVEY